MGAGAKEQPSVGIGLSEPSSSGLIRRARCQSERGVVFRPFLRAVEGASNHFDADVDVGVFVGRIQYTYRLWTLIQATGCVCCI